jgi:hypothetical protein
MIEARAFARRVSEIPATLICQCLSFLVFFLIFAVNCSS